LKVKWRMRQISRSRTTITRIFEQNVTRHPCKVMFICNDIEYTFKQIDDLANRIGNYFSSQDFGHGDVVDVIMDSKPEFVALWLGLAKIGCTASLVNTNLRNQSLVHCIKVAEPRAVIVDPLHVEAVDHIRNELSDEYKYFVFGKSACTVENMVSLDEELQKVSSTRPDLPLKASPSDALMYIYTSGTTGLPKAAVITHYRYPGNWPISDQRLHRCH
jgi:solute carrier family 27 fatty acid transporter 1/4